MKHRTYLNVLLLYSSAQKVLANHIHVSMDIINQRTYKPPKNPSAFLKSLLSVTFFGMIASCSFGRLFFNSFKRDSSAARSNDPDPDEPTIPNIRLTKNWVSGSTSALITPATI